MTTKKVLFIIGGVVAVLVILGALFVGGIVWVAFSAIGKSEAAQTAKTFLQNNEQLKSDIGEVREFGFWVTGNINSNNNDGIATLNFKVKGARKTVPAIVNLAYSNGRDWRVVEASYKNDAGQIVQLLNLYEREGDVVLEPGESNEAEAGSADEAGGAGEKFDEESFAANVTQAEGTTLVVFLSKYSLDSKALEKTLDEVAADYSERANLVRYGVDEQPALYRRFNIEKLPVVVIYKDGREQERLAGAVSKQQLSGLLDKYLETE